MGAEADGERVMGRVSDEENFVDDLVVNSRLTIPASCLSMSASRSGGPGGQHVNKTNSRVSLTFELDDCPGLGVGWRDRVRRQFGSRINADGQMVLHSETHRHQSRNLDDARQRLAAMLIACEHPPKKRRATKRTRGSQRRRLDAKKQRGELKQSRSKRYRPND